MIRSINIDDTKHFPQNPVWEHAQFMQSWTTPAGYNFDLGLYEDTLAIAYSDRAGDYIYGQFLNPTGDVLRDLKTAAMHFTGEVV